MPTYDSHTVIELTQRIRAFVSLKAGVTREKVPDFKAPAITSPDQDQSRELQQVKNHLAKQKESLEKQRWQLSQYEQQLAKKNRRIAHLEERLIAARNRISRSENVVLEGITLPPRSMRPCGPNFQDDEFYLASAKKEADMLVERLGLSPESSLLDVGSGPGRLAIGIIQRLGGIEKYRGLDVSEDSVRWGQRHITPEHPNFQFVHIDVENRRYNPKGEGRDSNFTFPFEDGEFDIITLYSVFTHMLTDGVRAYLKAFQQVLRSNGRIYLTAFVEDGVPDVEENPQGYLGREWKGALHCVRYERQFFEKLLDESGFRLDESDLHTWNDNSKTEQGQRGLYVSRKNE